MAPSPISFPLRAGSLAQPGWPEARKDQVGEDNSGVPRGPLCPLNPWWPLKLCSHTLLIGHGDRVYVDLLSNNYYYDSYIHYIYYIYNYIYISIIYHEKMTGTKEPSNNIIHIYIYISTGSYWYLSIYTVAIGTSLEWLGNLLTHNASGRPLQCQDVFFSPNWCLPEQPRFTDFIWSPSGVRREEPRRACGRSPGPEHHRTADASEVRNRAGIPGGSFTAVRSRWVKAIRLECWKMPEKSSKGDVYLYG